LFYGYDSAAIYQWGVVLGASLIAALWDLKNRRIPNVLTLPLFAAGLLQAALFSGWDGLTSSFAAGVLLALPYVVLFLFAGGGAGDAKLMGAIGTWVGLSSGLVVLVFVSLFGILVALLKAAYKGRFFAVLNNIRVIVLSFMVFVGTRGRVNTVADTADAVESERMTVPYGPAIFAGVLCAALYSFVFSS
jgi:prepilin peptidase CpaA